MYEYDDEYRNAMVVHDHSGAAQRVTGGQVYSSQPGQTLGPAQVIPAGPQAMAMLPYGQPFPTPYPAAFPGFPPTPFPAGAYPGFPGSPYGVGPFGGGDPYGWSQASKAKMVKTIGVVVDILGQSIAAIMPVPLAPQIVGTPATDTENMKRYQEALAGYAKTDERIRTVAKVVREACDLVKRY